MCMMTMVLHFSAFFLQVFKQREKMPGWYTDFCDSDVSKSIHSSVRIVMPYNLLYIPMRLKWPILLGHTGDFTNHVRNVFM